MREAKTQGSLCISTALNEPSLLDNVPRSRKKILKGLNLFNGTNLTLNSDADQDT